MNPDILYSTEPPIPFKLSEVKCPFCGGLDVEDISHELIGNKLFNAENQKLYKCNGKRWHKFRKFAGYDDGKRQYNPMLEYIDCETEFLITKKREKLHG